MMVGVRSSGTLLVKRHPQILSIGSLTDFVGNAEAMCRESM